MPVIVGVHRSGTTLLRMMLDAHPALAIPPETHFMIRLLQVKDPLSRERFLDTICSLRNWTDFASIAEDFRARILALPVFDISSGLRTFYAAYAYHCGKSRWGDKTPRYITVMTGIQSLLPEAHFIHILRDGRDVALSCRHLWFGPGDDLDAQARNWVDRIVQAREQAASLDHYIEIRYEDLVENPRRILEEVCVFLKLPYNISMERYYEHAATRLNEYGDHVNPDGTIFATGDQRRVIHQHTTQPPDVSRVGVWRNQLTHEERIRFEQVAGPLLRMLGYETNHANCCYYPLL